MEKNIWNKDLMNELIKTMSDASICGLGQAAGNPISSVLKYFKKDLSSMVEFFINDKKVKADTEDTIWTVAKKQGITLPHLCFADKPGYRATHL